MRDPNNLKSILIEEDKVTILKIDDVPDFDIKDYDLDEKKDFDKYMTRIEKNVRNSYEYKQMVSFLRDNMDMNKCSFYENVNNIDSYKIKIHIHHDPITLYDICIVVYNKRKHYGEILSDEMVAKEVTYLHYCLLVGLIPLSETVHELVHNQYLFVPTNKVMGHYKQFVDLYCDFFLPEQLDVLERIEKYTENYQNNIDILNKSYVYIDLSGAYNFPSYEDIIGMMSNRIKEIKEERDLRNPITKHT